LVAKKNGNCQNETDRFLQFFHSVKTSYERWVRIIFKIQLLKKIYLIELSSRQNQIYIRKNFISRFFFATNCTNFVPSTLWHSLLFNTRSLSLFVITVSYMFSTHVSRNHCVSSRKQFPWKASCCLQKFQCINFCRNDVRPHDTGTAIANYALWCKKIELWNDYFEYSYHNFKLIFTLHYTWKNIPQAGTGLFEEIAFWNRTVGLLLTKLIIQCGIKWFTSSYLCITLVKIRNAALQKKSLT
jgi:hypothetical protein